MMVYRAVYHINHEMVTDTYLNLEQWLIDRTILDARAELGDMKARAGETSAQDITDQIYGPTPDIHLFEVKIQFPDIPHNPQLIEQAMIQDGLL